MSLPTPLSPASLPDAAARSGPAQPKLKILEQAAAGSRTSFGTLVSIAQAESNFDVNAKNRKSSAAGPFQMTERTWLQLVKRYGAEVGRADLAALVTSDGQGRASVGGEHRAQVLDARRDLDLSARLAAKLCDENRVGLTRKLGREPSEAEVRMAYFLGLSGAARLIAASDASPDTSVKRLLPKAYANHRPMFREAGQPLTAEKAAEMLEARYTREIAQAGSAPTGAAPTAAGRGAALPLPPAARPADDLLADALVLAGNRPPADADYLVLAPEQDRLMLQQRIAADASADEFESGLGRFLDALTSWRAHFGVL